MKYSAEFSDLDDRFEQQRAEEIGRELGINLFGDVEGYKSAKIRPYTEIFNPSAQISYGERQIIGSEIEKLADWELESGSEKRSEKLKEEARRYVNCQKDHVIKCCENDNLQYFIKIFCRSRICEDCGRIYRHDLEKKLLPILTGIKKEKRRGYYLSLLTLTVTSKRWAEYPNSEDLDRFYRESSLFLGRFYGKYNAVIKHGALMQPAPRYTYRTVDGHRVKYSERIPKIRLNRKGHEVFDYRIWRGAGFMAVMEFGADNNNLHLHSITYGPHVPHETLSKIWQEITSDSYIVDIRQVGGNVHDVAGYILKYITKPPATNSYAAIAQYTQLIKGSRRIRTGGIFYNVLSIKKEKKEEPRCPYCRGKLFFVKNSVDISGAYDLYDIHRQLAKNGRLPDPLQVYASSAEICNF